MLQCHILTVLNECDIASGLHSPPMATLVHFRTAPQGRSPLANCGCREQACQNPARHHGAQHGG